MIKLPSFPQSGEADGSPELASGAGGGQEDRRPALPGGRLRAVLTSCKQDGLAYSETQLETEFTNTDRKDVDFNLEEIVGLTTVTPLECLLVHCEHTC